ncbi:MAG: hypothetical protein J6386_13575 [Candidatus Synoicihabitans palmerolidicus]|nr:hypothetical protein [Candidatus Synoicihabitans palmerolidicus]
MLVTLGMGLTASLIPASRLQSRALSRSLQADTRSSHGIRLSQDLIIGQIAFCTILQTCGLVFYQSLRASLAFAPGFEIERLLYADVFMKSIDAGQRPATGRALMERVRALPGVEAVGMSMTRPLGGAGGTQGGTQITTPDFRPDQEIDKCYAQFAYVTPELLSSLDVPLLAGRDFRPEENEFPTQATIINETMLRRFWPGKTAHEVLGLEFQQWTGAKVKIVGVMRDYSTRPWTPARPLLFSPTSMPA